MDKPKHEYPFMCGCAHPGSRLALTIKEAADAIGISERTLRDLLPEIPHTRLHRRVVIPLEPLREWLHSRARAEEMGSKRVAEDILAALNGDSE